VTNEQSITQLLRDMKIDELSPIEAMTKLYELQRMAQDPTPWGPVVTRTDWDAPTSIVEPPVAPAQADAPAGKALSVSDKRLLQKLVDGWRLAHRLFSGNYVCIDPGHSTHSNVVANRVDDLRGRNLINADLYITDKGRAALAEANRNG